MKIKLFTVVLLTAFMLQFASVKANNIIVATISVQVPPPPPPRPPVPHIKSPFRNRHHHRRVHRRHSRLSIHLPPHPQGPPPPPPRP